jgi:hypothetical protein
MIVAAGGGHSPDEGGKEKKRCIRMILDEFHKLFRFIRSGFSHAATRWFRDNPATKSRIAEP